MALLVDLTPLRVSPAYRRLWTGFTVSGIGTQMATTAISLQVYDLTGDSFAVGLVGVFALMPIVALGLYGGALVDHYDRRTVALIGGVLLWLAALGNTAQAVAGNTSPWVLYLLAALANAGFAVVSPARSAIYPRLLGNELLPAANALNVAAMNASLTVGPLLAGVVVDVAGYGAAYALDAMLLLFAFWGLARLAPQPPLEGRAAGVPGLRSVLDGLRFLATRPNVRMTFLADFCAMILAHPRALFPAVAAVAFGGGASTVGLLSAAIAVGAMAAMAVSGPLGRVIHQGRAPARGRWTPGCATAATSTAPTSSSRSLRRSRPSRSRASPWCTPCVAVVIGERRVGTAPVRTGPGRPHRRGPPRASPR